MERFETVTSLTVPLPIKDVDTDMIIPAQFLTSISRDGFGPNLFARLKAADADFPLNKPCFAGAEILVADSNFGCGSSREHAVWAIRGGGFRVVIAKSFADIFASNSGKNGLLLVTLPTDVVDTLLVEGRDGSLRLTVNLETQTVSAPDGRSWNFEYDQFSKHCLLNGLDDLDYLRSNIEKIRALKAKQMEHTFFDVHTINNPGAAQS